MRAYCWLLLATMLVTTTGCGGCSAGATMSQMKNRAIPRGDDDEETTPALPPPSQPTVNAEIVHPPQVVQANPSPVVAPSPATTATPPVAPPVKTAVPDVKMPPAGTAPPIGKTQKPTIAEATAHLEKIAAALEAYAAEKRMYPKLGSYSEDFPQPLVSWRVEILPYLGYESLYRKFNMLQPWDSPANKKLLAEMPAEYQSLGPADTRTNYIAVVGKDAAVMGVDVLRPTYKFTDGVTNCVIVVEADDERAVPWTAPTETPYVNANARQGLFGRRPEGVLAIVGGGTVRRISPETSHASLAAMFSVALGDSYDATLLLPPEGPATEPIKDENDTEPLVSGNKPAIADVKADNVPQPMRLPPESRPPTRVESVAQESRQAIPDERAQLAGKKILAELYKEDYDRARTPQQKKVLIGKLLPKAEEMRADPVGHYLILMLIRDIALSSNDVENSLYAVDELAAHYQVDGTALQANAIDSLAKSLSNQNDAQALFSQCEKLLNNAQARDDFAFAQQVVDTAFIVAKRQNDDAVIKHWGEVKKDIEEAKTAYGPVPAAQSALKLDPNKTDANTVMGRYDCLYRRDWSRGLTYLSRGGDIKLKVLAQIDLSNPSSAQQQSDLGDQWFALAADARPYAQKSLELRAAYWYAQSFDALPGGLIKSRIQKRLRDIADKTGDATLQSFAANKQTLPEDE